MEATQTATRTNVDKILKEYNQESETTRKMLALVPEDKWDYKPHEKSMTLRQLATHLAEIAEWPHLMLTTTGLDFGDSPYVPATVHTNADLMKLFEDNLAQGRGQLEASTDEDLVPTWTIGSGGQIFGTFTKEEAIRHSLSQTIHHRAQLGVYLRLLNIPIPGSYGPSADSMSF